jgi:hypothetical protein
MAAPGTFCTLYKVHACISPPDNTVEHTMQYGQFYLLHPGRQDCNPMNWSRVLRHKLAHHHDMSHDTGKRGKEPKRAHTHLPCRLMTRLNSQTACGTFLQGLPYVSAANKRQPVINSKAVNPRPQQSLAGPQHVRDGGASAGGWRRSAANSSGALYAMVPLW